MEDGYVHNLRKIGSRQYSSDEATASAFDRRRRGCSNPVFADCDGANFSGFWEALRKANNLKLALTVRQSIRLPTKNITSVLQPLGQPGEQLQLNGKTSPRRHRLSPEAQRHCSTQ